MTDTSQKYSCIAIDDENHALELIRMYVNKISFLEIKETFNSPLKAMDWLRSNEVDLIFLDIQMNDLTGLQFLDIADVKVPVILTTAYSEYALKSYEYKVADYLLKPFSFDRFLKAVNNSVDVSTKKTKVENEAMKPITSSELFIKGDAKNKYHRVALKDILYIEGLRNYVHIICDNKKIISLQNMKDLLVELPTDSFLRVHKSFIINVDKIDMLEGHSVLIGNKRIPIGASFRKEFLERIKGNSLG